MGLQVQDVERLHLGLLGVAACAAYLTGWLSAPSLLLGGGAMAVNVWIMRQLSGRLLVGGQARPAVVIALVLAKFALFMGLLGLLFWRVQLDALAFGVGASLFLPACVLAALRARPVALAHS